MNNDFKILVVDDTPELLDITIKVLEKANYKVFSAGNGADCMKFLRQEKPDLVLLDVMLPDADGKVLAKTIKSDPELSSIFVILLSSLKISTDNIAEGLEQGADGYIARPVSSRELVARIASFRRIIAAEIVSRKTMQKFYSLFSSMQEGVYLHEMIYDEKGEAVDYRIVEANPSSERILNIKVTDAIGKIATELYQTNEPPFLEIYAKVAESGVPCTFDHYFEPMHKYFHISVYSPERGIFATAFSDITERKLAEENLSLKNDELKRTNAEKDKFFSIIAHDLKSPFNGFLGLTQILEEEQDILSVQEIKELAASMRKSAVNLYRLLENLLEWSKMKQGLLVYSPVVLDLNSILNEVLVLVHDQIKRKKIDVIVSVPDNLIVFADNNMLKTILRNLISNAFKFTYAKGNISISARTFTDNYVEISIKDNGIGMTQNIIDNLFRLDVNTSRKGTAGEQSSGLGLILCKEFVEKLGGKIGVKSISGKGSTFYFTIPSKVGLTSDVSEYEKLFSESGSQK
jgi:signal transduction histidine kinase/DNA-binding response OmpR family regulator